MAHDNQPTPGSPESRWGSRDPEWQPSREDVAGLRRLVIETYSRLGPSATPQTIADDLRTRGVTTDPTEVARCYAEPY